MVSSLWNAPRPIGDFYITCVDYPHILETMIMTAVERFEAILIGGTDSPSLRFALGAEYAKLKETSQAIVHLRSAVVQDPEFSAAWKLLGKVQVEAGLVEEAIDSYRKGIRVATQHGDIQASREMKVFLKRLQNAN